MIGNGYLPYAPLKGVVYGNIEVIFKYDGKLTFVTYSVRLEGNQ